MAVGNCCPTTLPARRTAAQARHFRARSGLVDEDEAFRIKVGLCREPGFTPSSDVRPILFGGVRGFF
jgi:hypothetical protein